MAPKDSDTGHCVPGNKMNPRNNATMFQIFQNVQYNVVQHKKYVKELKKLYKKLDEEVFRESFKNALQYLFTFGDTSANVDRVIQFIATFCTSLDDEEEFLLFIFDIIFDCQCVSGQSVRYRASQLLAAVLAALGEDASLDDDLCDKLLASQMQRLQDTRGAVRCRAALALQRLQNPMEQDDEVTRAYRFHVSCDPSSSVRRAIVMSIAKCSRNVPYVLERLRDVDEAVRRAAFLYIAAINVTQLRVKQRVATLKVGLNERSTRVRRVVEEILIPGWLSSFKGNIVDLLKAIRLDNAHDAKDSQYVAGKLLESLFKRLPISELLEWLPTDKKLHLIPAEKLNKETAWYWRHLSEHLQKIDDDETLEVVLPDLVVLIGYIRAIIESPCPSEEEDPVGLSTRQYVLHELGSMLRVYDTTDPTGRTALQHLVTDILTGDYGPLNADVIRAFVCALELVLPDVAPRMELVCQLVSSLREPLEPEVVPPPPPTDCAETKIQRARLRVSLNVAMDAQEEAVRDQNYALAAECKAKVEILQKQLDELANQQPPPPPVMTTIKEKVTDAQILNKCLIILNCAMDTPQLKTVTPMLQMMFTELEVDIFQNSELVVNALETVALFGMLDKTFAKDNKAFFFANLIDTSNETVVCTVLRCIVDLLCVHGARVFEDDNTENVTKLTSKNRRTFHSLDAVEEDGSISESVLSMSPEHSTVIELLLKIMDSSCAEYRLIIVEGLCRLLHLGHIESHVILSRLMLLWFNPATVDEDMLRQVIGVFFQTFPIYVENAQEQIQKATIPTLRALVNAPSSSPLSEIDQEAVVRFIVSLTKVNNEMYDSQGAMATLVCGYLCRRGSRPEAALLCRVLALLAPSRAALPLRAQLQNAAAEISDKQACRNLTRYLGALEAMERASLNKISESGTTESTLNPEDTLTQNIGRITTSLPAPIARSTHVVVNETLEEEVEIDETSPTELVISRTSHGDQPEKTITKGDKRAASPKSSRNSDSSDKSNKSDTRFDKSSESDSGDVSPVKRVKMTKGKKKKPTITTGSKSDTANTAKIESKRDKVKGDGEKGVKRSRSQRSVVDVERAKVLAAKKSSSVESSSPRSDPDTSTTTVKKSTKPLESIPSAESVKSQGKKNAKGKKKIEPAPSTRVTRSSSGSVACESADETELHTIVYDKDFEQSLLNDSSELADTKNASKGNVTIPETPEGSEDSESEFIVTPKAKKNNKKKT